MKVGTKKVINNFCRGECESTLFLSTQSSKNEVGFNNNSVYTFRGPSVTNRTLSFLKNHRLKNKTLLLDVCQTKTRTKEKTN